LPQYRNSKGSNTTDKSTSKHARNSIRPHKNLPSNSTQDQLTQGADSQKILRQTYEKLRIKCDLGKS